MFIFGSRLFIFNDRLLILPDEGLVGTFQDTELAAQFFTGFAVDIETFLRGDDPGNEIALLGGVFSLLIDRFRADDHAKVAALTIVWM